MKTWLGVSCCYFSGLAMGCEVWRDRSAHYWAAYVATVALIWLGRFLIDKGTDK